VPKHELGSLVAQFGNEKEVLRQLLLSIRPRVPTSGIFEIVTQLGGQNVVVRGAVVNGITKIGTVFVR